jgi:hypothetical protein
VKNRKREICTSGSVRGEGGNILTYSALILGWGLNRQVSRLFTLEDTIDIPGCAADQFNRHGSVGDQPAVGDIVAERLNSG